MTGATFDTFVEGPSNRLALAAARRVAGAPGADANPLVLVGADGLGKSHLLEAIGAAVEAGGLQVERESVRRLAERAHGDRGGLLPLHDCDVLLLDDLEAVVDRRDLGVLVQELLGGRVPFRRQVVLASGRGPADLGAAAELLGPALLGGLLVELAPPDAGTRLAMLRRRATDLTPALADEVLTAVASVPIGSVRELLAALQRLVAFQAVSPAALDPDQARVLIGGVPVPDRPAAPPAVAMPAVVAPDLAVRDDEFGSFLSEVVASVSHQVDQWRTQVGEAILHYGGEGYRTGRLEALLEEALPARPAEALAEYRREVERLRAIEREAVALAPDLTGAAAFRDPDHLAQAEALLAQARTRHDPLPAPHAGQTLDRFAEGPGNRQAVQAVRRVAEAAGARYNPLVIVGPSGCGKSHLLHALGHALQARGIAPVACLDALALHAQLAGLQEESALRAWRARYDHAGALLFDDLHLLTEAPRAQEELLRLLLHLLEEGRQVAVTAVGSPATLAGLDPRLLTRLDAGLVVHLPPPDREVRLVIVKEMLAGTPADGDAALADWLASRPADSARAVQGAVHRVLSAAETQGVAPSPALAREVLDRRESPGTAPRRAGAARGPGAPGPTHAMLRSPEKMLVVWPRLADRLIEEQG